VPVLEKDPLEVFADIVGSVTILLVPLPVKILLELLNEVLVEVPVAVLLRVVANVGVVVVRLVLLVIDGKLVEVELKPLEVPVLNEVVLFEEVGEKLEVGEELEGVDELEVVVVKVESVAIDRVDDDDPVEEVVVVDELVGAASGSTQLHKLVSSAAVYFLNGDEGLGLVMVLV
jgi:hypothetical protein